MVGFFLGVLTILLMLLIAFLGFRYGQRYKVPVIKQTQSDKEALEHKLRVQGMQNVLNYNVDVALGKEVQNG